VAVPVTQVRFGSPVFPPSPEAWDVHLLRGQSTNNLREQLWVQDANDAQWKPLHDYAGNDIEISFVPVFKIVHDDSVPEYSNFGIHVDKKTGKVTVDNSWTADGSPHNFILEAFISDNGNGIPWIQIRSAVIRIHVHISVEQIWLTPSLLSIRRPRPAGQEEFTGSQFTVRAQFDDGIVGDLSFSDDLTYTPADWFLSRWVRIPAQAPNTVAPFKVKVTASAKWNNKSAEAQLEALQPWATEPDVPTADLLEGKPGVWDGSIKPENVPNIAILGCGFTGADATTFRMIADTVVHKLKRDPLLQPFGYLAGSMNYWGLMVPAQEAGVSVRCEVQQVTEGGQLFARLVPSPKEAPPTAAEWDFSNLIYMAGLPVPGDLNLVRDKQTEIPPPSLDALRALPLERLDFELLFAKWATIMRLDDPVHMIASIEREYVMWWIAMADRTFIDEVNSFPAISVGSPPAAGWNEDGLLAYHDFRGDVGPERDAFFKRVAATPRNGITVVLDDTGGQDPGLGHLWAEDRPGFAFDNRSFFVALSNSTEGRANFRVLDSGVKSRLYQSAVAPGGKTFKIFGFPVTRDATRSALKLALPSQSIMLHSPTWRVLAHELAHGFGLGDEYAELAERNTGPESDFNWTPNLMTESGARLDGEPEKISFGLIKWNWHRIRKASVITLPIDNRLDGTFRIFVRKGSGDQFAPGEFVRLRQRTRRSVINRDPLTSIVEFRVESIHPDNINHPQDPFNMTIVIKNESPLIDVSPFGPGSLIYLPVPTPGSLHDPLRPYLTLVSPVAELIMTKKGGSMTGTVCEIADQMGADTQAPRLPADLHVNVPDVDLPGLVGVYFGGHYACGVMHPTGQCLMRDSLDDASKFCPVCRYALVEQIDPEQHWQIDREYDKKYPLS
jgi:hypothetical protein